MKRKAIVFTDVCKAEYLEQEFDQIVDDQVLVRTEYSVVSGGTEKANIMKSENTGQKFPIMLGYCSVDYYKMVHRPGVKLIGAHNFVRPEQESFPHHWTHQDDCKAILDMITMGRIKVRPIVSRIVTPDKCPEIYTELCTSKDFPLGTVFDWRNIK